MCACAPTVPQVVLPQINYRHCLTLRTISVRDILCELPVSIASNQATNLLRTSQRRICISGLTGWREFFYARTSEITLVRPQALMKLGVCANAQALVAAVKAFGMFEEAAYGTEHLEPMNLQVFVADVPFRSKA
jgi:hypothetical protein